MLFPAISWLELKKSKSKPGKKLQTINTCKPRLMQNENLQALNQQNRNHQTQKYSNIK